MRSDPNGVSLWPDKPLISKPDLQELLLARMAGGDLYAMEEYQRWKRVDMLLDRMREHPIYSTGKRNEKNDIQENKVSDTRK